MFGLFSPSRRLRAAFAKQMDAMAQRLNEVVRERDKARDEAKSLVVLRQKDTDLIQRARDALQANIAKRELADAENARLHRELNAALVRCEELAGRADAADARAKDYAAGAQAAESVRDRAIEDMNHIQELQRAAERKLSEALDRLGKLEGVVSRVVAEISHVQGCVSEWAERVKGQVAGERAGVTAANANMTTEVPVVGRMARLSMTPNRAAG